MHRDEDEHQRRNEKDVDGEKAAQGRAADGRAAEDEPRQPIADQRNAPGLFGGHHHRPRGSLVPAQQLAGKPHDQSEAEQQHAGRPVHLAGKLVRAEQERLRHVRAHHQHHGGRAKVMHAAQETAERRVVGDEVQCLVGLRGRGDVGEASATPVTT